MRLIVADMWAVWGLAILIGICLLISMVEHPPRPPGASGEWRRSWVLARHDPIAMRHQVATITPASRRSGRHPQESHSLLLPSVLLVCRNTQQLQIKFVGRPADARGLRMAHLRGADCWHLLRQLPLVAARLAGPTIPIRLGTSIKPTSSVLAAPNSDVKPIHLPTPGAKQHWQIACLFGTAKL